MFLLAAVGIFVSGFISSVPALAADIHIQQHGYVFGDTVKSVEVDAFVTCDYCETAKLTKGPVPPRLAIRLPERISPVSVIASAAPVMDKGALVTHGNCADGCKATILFDLNSDSIKYEELRDLEPFLAKVGNRVVDVYGYTCDVGMKVRNLDLSGRRADAVAGYLRSVGINVGKVAGKGDCCPGGGDKVYDRRVEIKYAGDKRGVR